MKPKNKEWLNLALLNAAEMIRRHEEVGLCPEDLGLAEDDENGLNQYGKMCEKAAKMIEKLARKYN